ncbi:uncharacterized protein LOC131950482 [Physella acuta]|uniref:uncharacterized protein LOC131950482 n=1 Tax=Physella acuta TaxID=109671 RepID=UPI0027DD768B|nr:uncharacterized protein LOC131950482 [Physella acuta]
MSFCGQILIRLLIVDFNLEEFGKNLMLGEQVVFYKGFHETVNISFLSLSVADLLNLLPLTWTSFFVYNPFYLWHIETQEFNVYYVISTFPREIFTRISRWIKVYINVERFVSILSPMKVKEYFTKTTTAVVMTSIFSLYVIEMPIFYQCVQIVTLNFPPLNTTVLYIFGTDVCFYNESISIAFHAFSIICPCVLDLITACLIVYQLRKTNQWRSRSLTNERMQLITSRDLKLIKMILNLAVAFVLTTLPMWMTYVISLLERLVFINRYFGNIFDVMFSASTFLEAVGSSINVFIYYSMSSKYKQVFLALWFVREMKRHAIGLAFIEN